MKKIGIQELLSNWDMEVFKDHEGNYYVLHDGGEDYFHGKILEFDSLMGVIDCIPDSLIEEEIMDIGEQIHYAADNLEELKNALVAALTEDKGAPDYLRAEWESQLSIVNGLMGEVTDDVPKEKTNLILAIYEAMQQGLLTIKFSDTITPLGCSGVFCRVDIGTFQDEFYFNRYCADAGSLEEFYKMVENGDSRYDHWYSGNFFASDYEEGGYERMEMARDIAATLMDMTTDELEANEGCLILTCLQRSLPDYYAEVIGKEIDKAMETLKETEKENI